MREESLLNRTCPIRRVLSHRIVSKGYEDGRTMDWRHETLECGHEVVTYPSNAVPKRRRCSECRKTLPVAVCYLEYDERGRILTISRKEDPNQFGLIGGKVDPEDGDLEKDFAGTTLRACIREAREEAGVVLDPRALYEVYRALDYGPYGQRSSVPFISVVYSPVRVEGRVPQKEGEGRLAWLEISEFMKVTRFKDYNTKLFKALRKI